MEEKFDFRGVEQDDSGEYKAVYVSNFGERVTLSKEEVRATWRKLRQRRRALLALDRDSLAEWPKEIDI